MHVKTPHAEGKLQAYMFASEPHSSMFAGAVPQGRALSELRSLEETSAALVSSIQEGTLAKRQLLDDLIEAERQIMLSERKMQLEKEMQVGPYGVFATGGLDYNVSTDVCHRGLLPDIGSSARRAQHSGVGSATQIWGQGMGDAAEEGAAGTCT